MGLCAQGLPHQTVTWWFPFHDIGRFIGLAIKVCAIDVLESISIAKALAYRNQYELKCAPPLPFNSWSLDLIWSGNLSSRFLWGPGWHKQLWRVYICLL